MWIFVSCAAVDKISTDIVRCDSRGFSAITCQLQTSVMLPIDTERCPLQLLIIFMRSYPTSVAAFNYLISHDSVSGLPHRSRTNLATATDDSYSVLGACGSESRFGNESRPVGALICTTVQPAWINTEDDDSHNNTERLGRCRMIAYFAVVTLHPYKTDVPNKQNVFCINFGPIFMSTFSPTAATWQRCYFQVAFGVQIPSVIRQDK